MFIEKSLLDTRHREDKLFLSALLLTRHEASHVDGRNRGVELKMQSLFVTGLAVTKACELFGIAEQELDLKASLVITIDGRGCQLSVGREEHRSARLLSLSPVDDDDDPHHTLQADTPDRFGVERDAEVFSRDQFKTVETLWIDTTRILARAATFLLRAIKEVKQARVRTPFADDMIAQAKNARDKLLFGIKAIHDAIFDRFRKVRSSSP